MFEPNLEPYWARYNSLSNYLPILYAGLQPVAHYITETILMLILFTALDRFTKGWRQNKIVYAALFICIIIIIVGSSANTLFFWLVMGTGTAVIYFFAYLFVFRYQLELIPLSFGVIAILTELKQGIIGATPAALPGAIFAIFTIIVLSVFCYKKLVKG